MTRKLDLLADACMSAEEIQKVEWLKGLLVVNGPVLDIGPSNKVGNLLAEHFGVTIDNTERDLNDSDWFFKWIDIKRETIWCFDVIEHLMNPLLFLKIVRGYMTYDGRLFITYPDRPRWAWGPNHFHEYDTTRFLHMIDAAGFKVVRHEKKVLRSPIWHYFKGVRTLLRLTPMAWRLEHFYELAKK